MLAREGLCTEFHVVAVFAGIARNSGDEMTASCGGEHVREGEMSLGIPGRSADQEVFSLREPADEPDHDEAIAPVSQERRCRSLGLRRPGKEREGVPFWH
jgi:hypothetical protein